jgi:hypothetical protein
MQGRIMKARLCNGYQPGGVMGRAKIHDNATGNGRCQPTRNVFRVSARHGLIAASGVALLVAGVIVSDGAIPLGPILLVLGGLVLLVGFALPLVHQVQLGAPMLVTVTLAAEEQSMRRHTAVQDCRGLLLACAGNLCSDSDSAARVVEACVSDCLGTWTGTDTTNLRSYLLCLLIHEARFESLSHPAPTEANPSGHHSFMRLPMADREVLVLIDRAHLPLPTVATMLGLPVTEVSAMRTTALAAVHAAGRSS